MPWPSRAEVYRDIVEAAVASSQQGITADLVAALIDRESLWGNALVPPGPEGLGDDGHGHGLGQIDDRTWDQWLQTHDWREPRISICWVASYLEELASQLGNIPAAVAAYNCGPGKVMRLQAVLVPTIQELDALTTGGDYVSDVLRRTRRFAEDLT